MLLLICFSGLCLPPFFRVDAQPQRVPGRPTRIPHPPHTIAPPSHRRERPHRKRAKKKEDQNKRRAQRRPKGRPKLLFFLVFWVLPRFHLKAGSATTQHAVCTLVPRLLPLDFSTSSSPPPPRLPQLTRDPRCASSDRLPLSLAPVSFACAKFCGRVCAFR